MAYVDVDWIQIAGRRISIADAVMKEDLINASYPVGSVMIRIDNANPANLPLFEGTSWRKISEGKMIIGANSTYPIGTSGGNATHQHSTPALTHNGNAGNTTLSAAQSGMPAHRHTENAHTHPPETAKFVVSNEDLSIDGTKRAMPAASQSGKHIAVAASTGGGIGERANTGSATATINDVAARNASAAHTHTINHTHAASSTGSGSSMPPYLAVNMWLREA